jgi:hypothetical protein
LVAVSASTFTATTTTIASALTATATAAFTTTATITIATATALLEVSTFAVSAALVKAFHAQDERMVIWNYVHDKKTFDFIANLEWVCFAAQGWVHFAFWHKCVNVLSDIDYYAALNNFADGSFNFITDFEAFSNRRPRVWLRLFVAE